MPEYRFDDMQFCSNLPTYANSDTPTGSINISGSIPNMTTQNYQTSISWAAGATFADVYAINQNTGRKVQLVSAASLSFIYQYASTETAQAALVFNPTDIVVSFSISNYTGNTLNLINQTYEILVVEYAIPF